MDSDWRDGFFFVGNHLAVDFLNTLLRDGNQVTEGWADGSGVARWLAAAELISAQEAERLSLVWVQAQHLSQVRRLRHFRERWREQVFHLEAGGEVDQAFLNEINREMRMRPLVRKLLAEGEAFEVKLAFSPKTPMDVLGPLVDAIAELLASGDRSLLRKCRTCPTHFYDTSKKGTRQWCSMNVCGNRSKVAAFTKRRRDAQAG